MFIIQWGGSHDHFNCFNVQFVIIFLFMWSKGLNKVFLILWFDRNGESSGGGSLSDSGLESDAELAHSFDILPDMDFGKLRPLEPSAGSCDM